MRALIHLSVSLLPCTLLLWLCLQVQILLGLWRLELVFASTEKIYENPYSTVKGTCWMDFKKLWILSFSGIYSILPCMYRGLSVQCKASSRLFSVPPAIFLCAHIKAELVATEDRQVFLYSLCEMCVCARMSFVRKTETQRERACPKNWICRES